MLTKVMKADILVQKINKQRAAEKELMRIKPSNISILPFVNLNFTLKKTVCHQRV